jgi:toxin YoeB
MRINFTTRGWEEYLIWQFEDRKILRKINSLIKDIQSTPFAGMGKPELLKYDLAGLWSRRIDREHRLVYRVQGDDLLIYSCRYHYDAGR